MEVWTLGRWTATPGHEEQFVAAWQEFAQRTKAQFPAATAVLVRDREASNVFFSFGPWQSTEQIDVWRSSVVFQEGVAAMRAHLESFEPHTLDTAVRVD